MRGEDPDLAAIVATAPGDPLPPAVSTTLVEATKHMMAAEPKLRLTLAELGAMGPMVRTRVAMTDDDYDDEERGPGAIAGRRRGGPPLADEEDGWLDYVLGTEGQ